MNLKPVRPRLWRRLASAATNILARLGHPATLAPVFTPTVASAPLRRAPRPELGPNQIAWLEKRSPIFRRSRRAAMRARQQADRHAVRTKGTANG